MSKTNWWKEEGFNSRADWEKQGGYGQMVSGLVYALLKENSYGVHPQGYVWEGGAFDEGLFDEGLRAFIESEIIPKAPKPEELRETLNAAFRSLKEARTGQKEGITKEKARRAALDKAIKENSLSGYFAAVKP